VHVAPPSASFAGCLDENEQVHLVLRFQQKRIRICLKGSELLLTLSELLLTLSELLLTLSESLILLSESLILPTKLFILMVVIMIFCGFTNIHSSSKICCNQLHGFTNIRSSSKIEMRPGPLSCNVGVPNNAT
jgi:hypothetical protein